MSDHDLISVPFSEWEAACTLDGQYDHRFGCFAPERIPLYMKSITSLPSLIELLDTFLDGLPSQVLFVLRSNKGKIYLKPFLQQFAERNDLDQDGVHLKGLRKVFACFRVHPTLNLVLILYFVTKEPMKLRQSTNKDAPESELHLTEGNVGTMTVLNDLEVQLQGYFFTSRSHVTTGLV